MSRSRITERQLAAERVADHTDRYQEDENPLRAWLVYRECRRFRLRVPAWVLEYFDRVAIELEVWAKRKAPANLPPALLHALEMRRAKGTVFTALKESDRDFVLAAMLDIEGRVRKWEKKRTKARRVAEAASRSRQTVERAAKRFKDAGFFDRGRLSP